MVYGLEYNFENILNIIIIIFYNDWWKPIPVVLIKTILYIISGSW